MKLKFLPIILFIFTVLFFFKAFILAGKLPIPADTIIGLYHPFRDLYAKDYPNGIPFKNSLITDPVRQQYPWRELSIAIEKKLELPLWNPYSFSGTPLLANLQSAPFYPLNIIFFVLPFNIAWGILIFFELLLGGVFIYLYLNNLELSKWASMLGAISFSFSGFFVAWMEWGTILHVGLWLPLILLSIDNIFFYLSSENSKLKTQNSKLQLKNKKLLKWSFIFIFSLISSFFAGHLQTFFYLFMFLIIYFFARWFQYGKIFNILFIFLLFNILFLILTAVQWLPTLQFILLSARSVDQGSWQNSGWFIPWQNLIQFIAPDFFGNPTTLNYWGVWNYGEFIGYVGILPFIMAVFALFFRHDKKTKFFGTIFFISLIFSLPTIFAKLPYILNIPFLSSAQPTRLLFIVDFSLAVLAAFGFDYFIRNKKREIIYPLTFIGFIIIGLWIFVLIGKHISTVSTYDLSVAKHNLSLPTTIFTIFAILLMGLKISPKINRYFTIMIYIIIVIVTSFDLLRFGFKFTPFTQEQYLFPQTKILSFLQRNLGNYRFMTTDSRIFPPNFSVVYRLQSIDGYDPLYLLRYGELIAASERKKPNIDPPFGFNRIITPHNYESKIIDLLGVKYVLSLSDLSSTKLKKVFQEGKTRVYENKNVLPHAFFVEQVKIAASKIEAIQMLFDKDFNPHKSAIVEDARGVLSSTLLRCAKCDVDIIHYSENRIIIEVASDNDGFLVLTDSFYPTWYVKIDNIETKIYRTDYNFRGIIVPKGKHTVIFYDSFL